MHLHPPPTLHCSNRSSPPLPPFSYIGEVWAYKKVAASQGLLQFPPHKSPPRSPPPDPDGTLASPLMSPPGLNRLAAHNLSTFGREMQTQNPRSRSPSPDRSPSPGK